MHLNHANLVTTDVVGLVEFFTRHFGFELVAMRGKDAFAILGGSDGFALNIMAPPKGETSAYPESFHIGFLLGAAESVHAQHAAMRASGAEGVGDIQNLTRAGHATTIFYTQAPDGILVEVSATA